MFFFTKKRGEENFTGIAQETKKKKRANLFFYKDVIGGDASVFRIGFFASFSSIET